MVTQVVTWAGAVLGLLVLVLMALSGVFVDSQR
ncbi:NADH:ubiquinone oxidoreductase subunit 6 (subunit J) [Saccharothrix violaceirubra]|uniref:NADH:ubiquinone oxidoreductase subunit 6 (Subunit J) n=1 Tax=Saccharothrix violaceirubra TaxID=413306 RepID=A0A7W7TA75_9PSEU|nr:NADH:ubiquinone oxidoreductase subunit 6 (subunit J) [Saccharothrix violaceirubra]